jgi:type IV pilus assembly protein PilZ
MMVVVELRRHPRVPLGIAVQYTSRGATESASGTCKDISIGGMFIQTPTPPPFGAELIVRLELPGHKAPLSFPAIVRWTRPGQGMGVQFRLLGARETHAITELTRGATPAIRQPRG